MTLTDLLAYAKKPDTAAFSIIGAADQHSELGQIIEIAVRKYYIEQAEMRMSKHYHDLMIFSHKEALNKLTQETK